MKFPSSTTITIVLATHLSARRSRALKIFYSRTDEKRVQFSEGAILTYYSFVLRTMSSIFGISIDYNWTSFYWKCIKIRCLKIHTLRNKFRIFNCRCWFIWQPIVYSLLCWFLIMIMISICWFLYFIVRFPGHWTY